MRFNVRQVCLAVIFFMLAVPTVFGAKLHGIVYDISLDPVKGVGVVINTTPNQRYLTSDGSYAFEIPRGEYVLKATLREGDTIVASAEEHIIVEVEGDFVLDLILYPHVIDDTELLETDALSAVEEAFAVERTGMMGVAIVMGGFLMAFLLISFFLVKEGRLSNYHDRDEHLNTGLPSDLRKICDVLSEAGGRMTQKDLRKKLPYSEAKVSLMVAELEERGRIKKYRRGRGNILALMEGK